MNILQVLISLMVATLWCLKLDGVDSLCIQDDTIPKLMRQNVLLSRQVMMQQQFNEERIRSSGNSGIKAKRHRNEGTRPYYSDGYTGLQFLSMHDHANHRTTVGMGEFAAVLNGVEFRTRHNDYGLYRPSTTTNIYNDIEPIELPDVPPEVLAKRSVRDQIKEMRLWFKAFKDMNDTVRDYKKFFKPVLCYLEGAWTLTDPENSIDEPFKSDRHSLYAIDWNELHRKTRFASYSGKKNNGENLAFLPTTILDMVNDTEPVFAQWNYRIMCHPLNKYLEADRLRVVDDLSPRMAFGRTLEEHRNSRSARFQLNSINSDEFQEGFTTYEYLDNLMYEIPGKDNYRRYLTDDSFGLKALNYQDTGKLFNAGRYHRWYQVSEAGANGRTHRHRGFSDSNLFVALNTQSKVAPQTANDQCKRDNKNVKKCAEAYEQRWSYAIPLEIIYLTPLGTWNPYKIKYTEDLIQPSNRDGGMTASKAYIGANNKHFYLTPSEFFSDSVKDADAADTSGQSVGMLNRRGNLCSVRASGVRVLLPEIKDVGVVRTRYPIAPVHQEGDPIWKELQALRDMILLQEHTSRKLRGEFEAGADGLDGHNIILSMQYAPAISEVDMKAHTHTISLSSDEISSLKKGDYVDVVSSEAEGHSHKLRVKYSSTATVPYTYVLCDSKKSCSDKHGVDLKIVK